MCFARSSLTLLPPVKPLEPCGVCAAFVVVAGTRAPALLVAVQRSSSLRACEVGPHAHRWSCLDLDGPKPRPFPWGTSGSTGSPRCWLGVGQDDPPRNRTRACGRRDCYAQPRQASLIDRRVGCRSLMGSHRDGDRVVAHRRLGRLRPVPREGDLMVVCGRRRRGVWAPREATVATFMHIAASRRLGRHCHRGPLRATSAKITYDRY